MTVYARGYRPYDGEKAARRLRFAPIVREGVSQALRTRSFWILFSFGAGLFLLTAVMLYLREGFLEVNEIPALRGVDVDEEQIARETLKMGLLVVLFGTALLGAILALFTGCGLVADDLRARALPLYLVRPITPFDYYLGKILIPIRVLAISMLVPSLALVLIAALFRPSGRSLSFLWEQRDLVGAVLVHFTMIALSYSSLALLASAWTGRRVGAMVLGGAILFGGHIPAGLGEHVSGPVGDVLQGASLMGDAFQVYQRLAGTETNADALAPVSVAVGVPAFVVLLCAWTIVRRARTVEVVA